jgi:hypothetical protein
VEPFYVSPYCPSIPGSKNKIVDLPLADSAGSISCSGSGTEWDCSVNSLFSCLETGCDRNDIEAQFSCGTGHGNRCSISQIPNLSDQDTLHVWWGGHGTLLNQELILSVYYDALPFSDLWSWLDALAVRELTLSVDTCFSGCMGVTVAGSPGDRLIGMASSGCEETSWEHDSGVAVHGLWTYCYACEQSPGVRGVCGDLTTLATSTSAVAETFHAAQSSVESESSNVDTIQTPRILSCPEPVPAITLTSPRQSTIHGESRIRE